jgi:DNA topoisomerase-2
MELAFDNKKAPARKNWIAQYKEVPGMEGMECQHITHFMNHEFITFAIANIARSIPRFIDGLKTSQRKAIWASILKFKRKPVRKADSFKVSRFSGYIADVTDYAHGETCMADTIVKMAQDYTGSNNIPYFTRDGQFGTRFHSGADAGSSRYITCRPELLIPYIFRAEDDPILKFDKSEGLKVEPKELYPIIPLSLINGASGIGTAWSTYVCNHDPRLIIDHILKLLDNPEHQVPYLTPWYRGYYGSIELVVKNKKREEATWRPTLPGEHHVPEDLEGDDIFYNENDAVSVKITGRFHQAADGVTIVTEIPVGKSFVSYKIWLESLLSEGEIEDFENLSTDDSALFIIKGFQSPTLESLRLVRRIGTSNMVFLDSMGTPSEYMHTPLILTEFVRQRLQKYQERKDSIIRDIDAKIKEKEDRRQFIKYVIDGEITFRGVKLSDLKTKVESLNLPTDLISKVTVSKFTEDEVQLLEGKIAELYRLRQEALDTSIQYMWKKDLAEFMREYDKIYPAEQLNPDYIHVSKIARAMENINAGSLVHRKTQKKTKKKSNVIVS